MAFVERSVWIVAYKYSCAVVSHTTSCDGDGDTWIYCARRKFSIVEVAHAEAFAYS